MITEHTCEICGEVWHGESGLYGSCVDGITLCCDCAEEQAEYETIENETY